MKDLRIAIAGGGIGGLTLAAALARKGIDATVLEQAPAYSPVGAGITMQINAMQALRHIGLAEKIAVAGIGLNRLVLRTWDGSQIFATDMAKPATQYGAPFIGIHRAKLHEVLLAALAPKAVTLGFSVQEFSQSNKKVVVTSTDGRQVEADILVGADGLRSRVRQQLWGDEPLRYSGCTSWRGVIDNDGFVPSDEAHETWGDHSNFGMFPMDEKRAYWFATELTEPGQSDADDPRPGLFRLFGHWHNPIQQVIEATPKESIIRTDIWDRPPRSPWGQGQVTLLGDAAHAMTPNMGQGGGQAVEDAIVLAEALSRATSIPHALREYEQKRFVRTKFFVDNSRRATRISHGMTPLLSFARKWVVPQIPEWFRERQVQKVFHFET